MSSFELADFSQVDMIQIHLLTCEPASRYTIGPRNKEPKVNLNDQIFENFEDAQTRPDMIRNVSEAHTTK